MYQTNKGQRSNEIDIWEIDLDKCAAQNLELGILDPHETLRYERFKYEKDRKRFALSHIARRKILAGYIGMDPAEIRYGHGTFGKPFLDLRAEKSAIHFSFTHSDTKALLAVGTHGPLGVDLEKLSGLVDYDPLIDHVCTTSEAAKIRTFPEQRRDTEFLNYWTAKEAYLKGIGSGLSVEPRLVEVSSDFTSIRIYSSKGLLRLSSWQLLAFEVKGGFSACLAVSRQPLKIHRRIYAGEHCDSLHPTAISLPTQEQTASSEDEV